MIKFNPFVVNGHPLFLPIPLTNCKHDTANSTSRTEPYPIVRRSEIVDPRVRGHVGIDHRFAPDGIPVSKLEGVKYSNPMNLHTLNIKWCKWIDSVDYKSDSNGTRGSHDQVEIALCIPPS